MRGQLAMYDVLPFEDTMKPDDPGAAYADDDPDSERDADAFAAFDAWLKDKGFPYVEVTEAKRAIFAGAKLDAFDFLVYSQAGPNLLVLLTADPTPDDVDLLREWEKTFGPGFAGAFVWQADGEWVTVLLNDWNGNKLQARSLRDHL